MTIANVALTDTFDVWRTRTNQLIVQYDETNTLAVDAYNATNNWVINVTSQTANALSSNVGYQSNIANLLIANATFNSNLSNVLIGNAGFTSNVSNNISTNTYAISAIGYLITNNISNFMATNTYVIGVIANNTNGISNAAFTQANAAYDQANTAYNQANVAIAASGFYRGNNGDKGNTTNKQNVFRVNTNELTANIGFDDGENASATGPITINTNRYLLINTGARVVII